MAIAVVKLVVAKVALSKIILVEEKIQSINLSKEISITSLMRLMMKNSILKMVVVESA